MAASSAAAQSVPTPVEDPTPQTLDAFKAAVAAVLEETGVPGAGIALVNVNGTEWAGGVGWADRDRRVPVTADTHFRAGSISKSFVALALVQLYEDGKLDLDARLSDLVPDVAIENPWAEAAPVTVRQLLEHTAGFDDMHFNEIYVLDDAPDLPLEQVLMRNPASRRVRWRPGTRMSYANPGYAVAGLVVEKVSGMPYDEFIEQRIFTPLEMPTSSFRLAPEADSALAQGYAAATGPPVDPPPHLPAAGRGAPHLGRRTRPLRAGAARLGRTRRRLRRRPRIPLQHGVAAHDPGQSRRRARRATDWASPARSRFPTTSSATTAASTASSRPTATRRPATSATWC